jgi:hypothetical protein
MFIGNSLTCGRLAISLSLDNTFKSAGKAVVIDKDRNRVKLLKGGILSVINEKSEILAWVCRQNNFLVHHYSFQFYWYQRFCQSASPAEIHELLEGIKRRCSVGERELPEILVVDNCCQVRRQVCEVMPEILVVLDVYHFLMRCGKLNTRGYDSSIDHRDSLWV